MGVVVMSPLAGAAVALHQHSWEPLGYGAVAAAAVFVAFAVGAAVVGARQAHTEALRAENEVHPDRVTVSTDGGETWRPVREVQPSVASLAGERDWYREALARLIALEDEPCSLEQRRDGYASARSALVAYAAPQPVVRRGSESGERATDVTDATESPGPATGGA
jgi:hypothetical protein